MNTNSTLYATPTFSYLLWLRRHWICPLLFLLVSLLVSIYLMLRSKKRALRVRLVEKKILTHDTIVLTFALPKRQRLLGLKVGYHLQIDAGISSYVVSRKYTPITRTNNIGSLDLLIKVYRPCDQFPNGGIMSQYLNSLTGGSFITVSLPYGKFNYLGYGKVSIRQDNGKCIIRKHPEIYMIGGGTGITPLYQLIQYICEVEADCQDAPKLTLLFANRTEDDILLEKYLRTYQKNNEKFRCFFTVDKSVRPNWYGYIGFIDQDKLAKTIPADVNNQALYVSCGPPIMCNNFEKTLMNNFKISPERIFRF